MSKPYVEFHEPSPANGGDTTVVIPPNFPRRPAPITFTCLRSELVQLYQAIEDADEDGALEMSLKGDC